MQFNQFSMYAYNANSASANVLDEVDICRQDLLRITEYNDVKNYIKNKFGEFEGEKWIKYTELDKYVYLYIDDTKVHFCALKDKKQYWGRGWELEDVNDL